jgi:predicted  nucleic acid-binding Zn-ribbon protein
MKQALQTRRDYFVRERYAATSQSGFHTKLAEFLGWSLPMAPRHDDEDCPLYLETIFPLFYVEQKLGWGRIPAKYPTYLGIRDVGRRTVEFLLGLDAYAIAIERAAVQAEIVRVRAEWTTLRMQTAKRAAAAGGLIGAIPSEPVSAWPPEIAPEIMMAQDREWLALPVYLAALRQRLTGLSSQPVPSSESASPHARTELTEAQSQLAQRELIIGSLVEKIETDSSEVEALKQRIESIEDDLRKYKDVRRLQKLGSPAEPETANDTCPTCHQELSDSLLDLSKKAAPMSVEQNVNFYEEQRQLFTAVLVNGESSIRSNEVQLQSHRTEVEKLRDRIRALRETLNARSDTPSVEALTERIRLESRVQALGSVLANFEDSLSEFAQLAADWKDVQERKGKLPRGALSSNDENKVNMLGESFRRQLVLYKMGSVNPQELNISRSNYEPEVAGLNLGADVSGSDLIRLQWAYLLGLLELGISGPTNHPGLLVMDEPQQQSVEESAFQAMLAYAANFQKAQVIIATSHERTSIHTFLRGIGLTNITEYEDHRVIRRS